LNDNGLVKIKSGFLFSFCCKSLYNTWKRVKTIMEGVREIITQKMFYKISACARRFKRNNSCPEEYMRTVSIFFLFGNISG